MVSRFDFQDNYQSAYLSIVLKESKAILDAFPVEDVLHAEDGISILGALPAVHRPESSSRAETAIQTVIKDMYNNWSRGIHIYHYVPFLLKQLLKCKSDPVPPEENLFILVSQIVPQKNQTCFTVALFKNLGRAIIFFGRDYKNDWESWLLVYKMSTLRPLREQFKITNVLQAHFYDQIGPDGVKLVLDAFVLFAGNLILSRLKTTILLRCHHAGNYTLPRHQFMVILDKLQARKLQVDQKWYRFLGRMLAWKTTRDLFLPTASDFEISDDDSTDSENEAVDESSQRPSLDVNSELGIA